MLREAEGAALRRLRLALTQDTDPQWRPVATTDHPGHPRARPQRPTRHGHRQISPRSQLPRSDPVGAPRSCLPGRHAAPPWSCGTTPPWPWLELPSRTVRPTSQTQTEAGRAVRPSPAGSSWSQGLKTTTRPSCWPSSWPWSTPTSNTVYRREEGSRRHCTQPHRLSATPHLPPAGQGRRHAAAACEAELLHQGGAVGCLPRRVTTATIPPLLPGDRRPQIRTATYQPDLMAAVFSTTASTELPSSYHHKPLDVMLLVLRAAPPPR